jgi:hypothetical protein
MPRTEPLVTSKRTSVRLLTAVAWSWMLGCGASPSAASYGPDGGGGGSVDAATTDATGRADGPIFGTLDGSAPPARDCPPEASVIYVVSDDDRSLYRFDPSVLAFTKVGLLACEPGTAPFAMSVARDGTAWVVYADGTIFRVSTKDASCSPTAYVPGQNGFTTFGMGFSADAPNATTETLFVCWTEGLARIDTTTLALTPVGAVPGLDVSSGCDLTGTGSAELFAFVPQPTQWALSQIDKTTSTPIWQHVVTPPIPAGGAWGTSFWGGDLYLYTAPGGGHSAVWRHRPADGTTVELLPDVGFTIVGAGESTCVPTTPQ